MTFVPQGEANRSISIAKAQRIHPNTTQADRIEHL